MKSFCRWCVKRQYLAEDPLKHLVAYDATPRIRRRAMTDDEVQALMEAAPAHRRVLYEAALCSGLRVAELRSLDVDNLDVKNSGLRLDAAWTKNRKKGFQRLARRVVDSLQTLGKAGTAVELYRKHGTDTSRLPENPLLFVPYNVSRPLDRDLKAAGIDKDAPGGRVDFHSLRTWYVSMVFEARATVKEAQVLARHSTPDLTLNVYGRARIDRLAELAETVGNFLLPGPPPDVKSTQRQIVRKAAGAENLVLPTVYDSGDLVGVRGFEPPTS
ncbi:MAG: site-specific integrase [Planctomycetes bacterium]|nr:site-specific integrase [Planctomycetota bacterium]